MSEVSKPCLKCGKLGIEKSAEILPDQGMLIQVIHDDGSKPCEFEEYASLSTFLTSRTKTKDPKIMECPVCGEVEELIRRGQTRTRNSINGITK